MKQRSTMWNKRRGIDIGLQCSNRY